MLRNATLYGNKNRTGEALEVPYFAPEGDRLRSSGKSALSWLQANSTCIRNLICAVFLTLILALTASAQGSTSAIGANDVNQLAWAANARLQINRRPDSARNSILMAYTLAYFRSNPRTVANLALKDINAYREELQQIELKSDRGYVANIREAESGLELVSKTKGQKAAKAELVKSILQGAALLSEKFFHSGTQIYGQRQGLNARRFFDAYAGNTAEELWALAKSNPEVATTVDAVFGAITTSSVNDNASTILRRNPTFATDKRIENIFAALQPDGSLNKSIDDLKREFAAAVRDTTVELKANKIEIRQLRKTLSDEWEKQREIANAQQRYEDRREIIAASAGAMGLIARLVGLNDRRAGEQLQIIGNSVTQIASAFNEHSRNIIALERGLGTVGTALGAASLTNNLLGAVITLTGAFQPQNNLEVEHLNLIREDLRALRQEVADLRDEMRESFRNVDTKLDQIMLLINTGFLEVVSRLDGIAVDLNVTRRELVRAAERMDALQRDIYQYANDALTAPMFERMNFCLGFKLRNPNQRLSYEEFDRCASTFHNWAVGLARTSTLSSSGTMADPYQANSPILLRSTDEKINLLATYAAQRSVVPAQHLLPNPFHWLAGTDAYITLAQQWPEHYLRASADSEDDLASTGNQLQTFQRDLALTKADGQTKGNFGLYRKLTQDYSKELDSFWSVLEDKLADWWARYPHPYNAIDESYKYGQDQSYPYVIFDVVRGETGDEETLTDQRFLREGFYETFKIMPQLPPCETSPIKLREPIPRPPVGFAGVSNYTGLSIPRPIYFDSVLNKSPMSFCYNAKYVNDAWLWPGAAINDMEIGWGHLEVEITGNYKHQSVSYAFYGSRIFSTRFIGAWRRRSDRSPLYPPPELVAAGIGPQNHEDYLKRNWYAGEKLADSVDPPNMGLETDKLLNLLAEKSLAKRDNGEFATSQEPTTSRTAVLVFQTRKALKEFIRSKVQQDSDVREALRRLSIAKRLIDNYLELAFPISIQNDQVRSLFRGESGLMDEDVLLLMLSSNHSFFQIKRQSSEVLRKTERILAELLSTAEAQKANEENSEISATLTRLALLKQLR